MSARPHPPPESGWQPAFVAQVLDEALVAADQGLPFAIAGLQGTGKSTLAAQLAGAAAARGRRALALSIDDFYLGRRERLRLGRAVHPLCATRGPPGTHDVSLACEVLDALRDGRPVRLPRFDKIADRRLPPSRWPMARATDLVLFEGWCLKVPPEAPARLAPPINRLEREEDPDATWRTWVNHALGRDYPMLWTRLPNLLLLQGPGFEVVPDWRWQQECTLQDAHPGRQAMTRPQVERFVQFFERVSRQALRALPAIADRVVRLDAARQPVS
jgi:D-glycerate 3-kinase